LFVPGFCALSIALANGQTPPIIPITHVLDLSGEALYSHSSKVFAAVLRVPDYTVTKIIGE
jgi:hypothetical protein